jgi:hypothetical protein
MPALFTAGRRRYRRTVLPLGFRFDVDAVIIAGVAHCADCEELRRDLPQGAVSFSAAGVHWADRCPRECPRCRPPFGTLLTHQLERSVDTLVR